MSREPLCDTDDVAAKLLRPLTDSESVFVPSLIDEASAKLRQRAPFDIDERMANFDAAPKSITALDPVLVSGVVATLVKRFLVNANGVATKSETVGPYSTSQSFVNRYDKTGSDVRGAIQVTDADIDELRPSEPTNVVRSVQLEVTRALQPQVGYRSYLDRSFADPTLALNPGPNVAGYGPFGNSDAQVSGNVSGLTGGLIVITTSGPLTLGARHLIDGNAAVVLTVARPATAGAVVDVRVADTYTGPGVTPPPGFGVAVLRTSDHFQWRWDGLTWVLL